MICLIYKIYIRFNLKIQQQQKFSPGNLPVTCKFLIKLVRSAKIGTQAHVQLGFHPALSGQLWVSMNGNVLWYPFTLSPRQNQVLVEPNGVDIVVRVGYADL